MPFEVGVKETILVTGSSGFLGNSIIEGLRDQYNVIGLSRTELRNNYLKCDLTDELAVSKLAKSISPTIIIHAAGLKDIQRCEKKPKLAHLINVHMVRNVSNHFPNAKIIYISTDYVFRGDAGMYLEKDTPNPATVYGETKYQGELVGQKIAGKNFKILRTASIFSQDSNFLKFLNESAEKKVSIAAYSDCIFSPTYIFDLLAGIKRIIENNFENNIFHVVGDAISRYSFAKSYFQIGNYDLKNLIKHENNGANINLFKNLSLSGSWTSNILGLKPTMLKDSLRFIIHGYSK